jgi:uracil-DNA glycosylase
MVRRRALAPVSRTRSLAALQRRNAACRRCLEAGFPIHPRPVFAGRPGQKAYLYGLAPGRLEAETGLPWQGRAGRTLRRWLRLDEKDFFGLFYCASVTRCFPGPSPGGRGDRRATPAEEALCASWRDDELSLLRPALVVTVGLPAAAQLLGVRRLTDAVGKSYLLDDAVVVPLPHPSGASGWLNDDVNRKRLGKALTHVRRELTRVTGTGAAPDRPIARERPRAPPDVDSEPWTASTSPRSPGRTSPAPSRPRRSATRG